MPTVFCLAGEWFSKTQNAGHGGSGSRPGHGPAMRNPSHCSEDQFNAGDTQSQEGTPAAQGLTKSPYLPRSLSRIINPIVMGVQKMGTCPQQSDKQLCPLSLDSTLSPACLLPVTRCGGNTLLRSRLNAGKVCWFCPRPTLGNIIPMETSLERVTRYLEIVKSLNVLPARWVSAMFAVPENPNEPSIQKRGPEPRHSHTLRHLCC